MIDRLKQQLPTDHSQQMHARAAIDRLLQAQPTIRSVLDLGCGTGASRADFLRRRPDITWVGLDIATSPEVDLRTTRAANLLTYDGQRIPCRSDAVDLVYSHQVFEHVRHPAPLLQEVARILKPGGSFAGSTSHLEPYHSHSLWNYTPYGFVLLLEAAGLDALELRPGIDAGTLMLRRALGRPACFRRWFTRQSPLNSAIEVLGSAARLSPQAINARKLLFCGQFWFLARKPGAPAGRAQPSD